MTRQAVVAIPARWEAQRFPGKVLAPIAGKPMLQHIVERCKSARLADAVVVATDDQRIIELARQLGAEAIFVENAASGSDRIAAALRLRNEIDIVVNVQGDEPLIEPAIIDQLISLLRDHSDIPVATIARPFSNDEDPDDPNRVKVVCDRSGNALYFSRARIPHPRTEMMPPLLHLGVYAYRFQTLLQFADAEATALEQTEQLEQLRLLEHGWKLAVREVKWRGHGVDTPEDIGVVEHRLKADTI